MKKSFEKILEGYHNFRNKYATGDQSVMRYLSVHGQKPKVMFIACSDSRVDPALILQCDPGDLFVVRNVANIVPPYEKDDTHHGTSAALEYAVCHLEVKHLILLGHSQCGGIKALLSSESIGQDDFISNWVKVISGHDCIVDHKNCDPDDYAKIALQQSRRNCMDFPWIKKKVERNELQLHLWYFDINDGKIFTYSDESKKFVPL